VFDGIHQWPPKEQLPDIFTWLRFDAMRQKAIPADRSEINLFIEQNDKLASALTAGDKLPMQQAIYIKMLHYLQGLTDVEPLKAEIRRLSSEKEVIAYNKQKKQLSALEQELQQKYSPQLQLQNVDWWKTESMRLRSLSKKQEPAGTNLVYIRLLGFLSMNSYMFSTNALKQGNLDAAARFIEIYRLIDPSNAEHRYMAAKVAAIKHNPDALFEALKQAFDLGFKDINRIKSDADFKQFQQDPRFLNLISGRN
jgi:hypothetical protein